MHIDAGSAFAPIRFSDGSPFSTSIRVFTVIRHNLDVDDSMFVMPARPPQKAAGHDE